MFVLPIVTFLVDYPLFVNNTLVSCPLNDRRFLYLATHILVFNTHISDERRRKEIQRLDTTYL